MKMIKTTAHVALLACSFLSGKSQVKIVEAGQVFLIESATLLYDSIHMKSNSKIKFAAGITRSQINTNVFIAEAGVVIEGMGANGEDGHHNDSPPGGPGTDGTPATDGVNFTLEVTRFVFCDLEGNFSGGDGGKGGPGTNGRKGRSARCCKGDGGDGTRGGSGGAGGNGGNAGSFTIKYQILKSPCDVPLSEANFNLKGGSGGEGGTRGTGGAGGNRASKCAPLCNRRGGKAGPNGSSGKNGSAGNNGTFQAIKIG